MKEMGDLKVLLLVAVMASLLLLMGDGRTPAFAQGKPTEIRLTMGGNHALEIATWVQQLHNFFIPEVKKRAAKKNYKIEIVEAWGGSVAKSGEVMNAIEKGILDSGYVTLPQENAKIPLTNFPYWLPFGPSDPAVEYKAARKVWETIPALKKCLEDYNQKFLGLTTVQSYGVVAKTAVNSLEDFKGKKMGGVPTMYFLHEAVGAVPIQADMTTMYTNLQTGLQHSHMILPEAIVDGKIWEVAPYWIDCDLGAISPHTVTINLKTWSKLPPDVQAILVEVGNEFSELSAKNAQASTVRDLAEWQKRGGKIIKMSAKDRQKWASLIPADFITKKAKVCNDKGQPGTAVIKAFIQYSEEQGYVPPRKWEIK